MFQPEEWQCVPELCAVFSAFESLRNVCVYEFDNILRGER